MKLFVWQDKYFCDWSCGLAVILAHDIEEARNILIEKIGYEHEDIFKEPEVYEITEPIGFFVYGGA